MKKVFRIDPVLLICTVVLLGIGIFTLYSLTLTSIETRSGFFRKEYTNQIIFCFVGLIGAAITFAVPLVYFKFKFTVGLLYLLSLVSVLFTVFFGIEIRGVRRWISIGGQQLSDGTISGGVTLQPSEFAKIGVIILTAALLSAASLSNAEKNTADTKIKMFLTKHRNILMTLGLNVLLLFAVFLQKSLSVTIVMAFIIFSMIFANIKNKMILFLSLSSFLSAFIASQGIFFNIPFWLRIMLFILALGMYGFSVLKNKAYDLILFFSVALGIIFGALILNFMWNHVLLNYQRDRVEAFLNPSRDTQKEGYQTEQSKISIGAGQFSGHGLRQVSDTRLLYLPEPTTDFIFAIFSFKFGFLGSIIIVGLYLAVILRLFYLSDKVQDRFSSLILVGIASMILIQFFSNVGMNLDILPVGGTTLPLLSAGGSSLISVLLALGLAQNVIATSSLERNNYRMQDKVVINGWNH